MTYSPNTTTLESQKSSAPSDQPLAKTAMHLSKHSHYRSRLFPIKTGINPLLIAANPLLSLNIRLRNSDEILDTEDLYQQLIHELNAFVSNLQNQSYRNETVLIARYLLCALLDETIAYAPWIHISPWEHQRLLIIFQGENNADERFFYILNRVCKNPELYLDLLELIYICLSLGFEGQYRHEHQGKIKLQEIKDELYQLIRNYKDDSLSLFATPATLQATDKQSLRNVLMQSILIIALITSISFLTLSLLWFFLKTPPGNHFLKPHAYYAQEIL